MATLTTESGGLLLVDKPAGISSHDVVGIARRALGTHRVGHTGTLDPFATGLLVILFGRGTRLIPYVPGEPKIYEAVIQFGVETDTDDRTGTPTRTVDPPSNDAIDAAIHQLSGTIEQIPPAYSAKQVGGQRAYAAARRGTPLALEPVTVTVHEWMVRSCVDDRLTVRIMCSTGTYIRALARDLGRLAQSAAHLAQLRRTQSGPFSVSDAVNIADLKARDFVARQLLSAVPNLAIRRLDDHERRRIIHGNSITLNGATERVALIDDAETLIAIAEPGGDALCPKLVLTDA